jgi:CspA family cold shock protein
VVGQVQWFNESKGYGFIEDADGNGVFMHASNIHLEHDYDVLREGDTVQFDLAPGKKGVQAVEVKRASIDTITDELKIEE